jgi:hypothetical protein
MSSVQLDSTPFSGRTSRPAAPIAAVEPGLHEVRQLARRRLERVQRERTCTTWIWKCGCGRRRRLRREAVSAM